MRVPKYLLLIILVAVLTTMLCVGQQRTSSQTQETNGKIQGVLLDINDARIVRAKIIIEDARHKHELKSGEEGDFEIQLPAGSYRIRVEANGFRKFEVSPFKVKANVTEMINIHMEVGVISEPLKVSRAQKSQSIQSASDTLLGTAPKLVGRWTIL